MFAGVGPGTFVRATTAWTKLASGLWTSVPSGSPRSCYLGASTAVGAYGGYLSESGDTNQCLQGRDLSNVVWIKTNTTAALDQTGIDGVGNSASSLTATLGGGTCLQTITEAATVSALSLFIKRLLGSGTVIIQQGATTLDVTALINGTTYTRVELDATVLNPTIGIVLGTNGDKIAVDMVQFENTGGVASSPIPTTTVAVTRNSDKLTYPFAGNASATNGTSYAEAFVFDPAATGGVREWISFSNAADGQVQTIGTAGASTTQQMRDGTNILNATALSDMSTGSRKTVVRWGAAALLMSVWRDGANKQTATFDGSLGSTAIGIGCDAVGGNVMNGMVKNAKIWTSPLTDAQVVGL